MSVGMLGVCGGGEALLRSRTDSAAQHVAGTDAIAHRFVGCR